MVEELAAARADVNVPLPSGKSSLLLAVQAAHVKVVTALLVAHAEIDRAAVTAAQESRIFELIKLLDGAVS